MEIVPCDEIMIFDQFHELSHTGKHIANWLEEGFGSRSINTDKDLVMYTADGAANGIKAMELVPGIDENGDVCLAHDQQRAIFHAFGLSTSSIDDKTCKNLTSPPSS